MVTTGKIIIAMVLVLTVSLTLPALTQAQQLSDYTGDIDRGRLVFGPCRTCHYPEKFIGHHNGPNLHAIFGKVAGKQEGFDYYSDVFRNAEFIWTPELLFAWLGDVEGMFPETSMMSLGVVDPQERADLIVYLQQFK